MTEADRKMMARLPKVHENFGFFSN